MNRDLIFIGDLSGMKVLVQILEKFMPFDLIVINFIDAFSFDFMRLKYSPFLYIPKSHFKYLYIQKAP